jgi:hypothetical protein
MRATAFQSMVLCSRTCLAVAALASTTVSVFADDKEASKDIAPAEARKHIGESVRVTMLVRKTKDSDKTKRVYLDSETDYRDAKNFGVVIEYAAKAKFKDAGIAEPHVYYKDKTIRVTGKPFLEDGLVFIKAASPEQITVVEKK